MDQVLTYSFIGYFKRFEENEMSDKVWAVFYQYRNFLGKLLWNFQIFHLPFASDILSFQILRFGKRFSAHATVVNRRGGFWQILSILQTYLSLLLVASLDFSAIINQPLSNIQAVILYSGLYIILILRIFFFFFYHCRIWKWTSSHWSYAK